MPPVITVGATQSQALRAGQTKQRFEPGVNFKCLNGVANQSFAFNVAEYSGCCNLIVTGSNPMLLGRQGALCACNTSAGEQ